MKPGQTEGGESVQATETAHFTPATATNSRLRGVATGSRQQPHEESPVACRPFGRCTLPNRRQLPTNRFDLTGCCAVGSLTAHTIARKGQGLVVLAQFDDLLDQVNVKVQPFPDTVIAQGRQNRGVPMVNHLGRIEA